MGEHAAIMFLIVVSTAVLAAGEELTIEARRKVDWRRATFALTVTEGTLG